MLGSGYRYKVVNKIMSSFMLMVSPLQWERYGGRGKKVVGE